MSQLILLRHGESTWNRERRFTGWADVPLTADGVEQMQHAAWSLLEAGFAIDVAFSSVLSRCIRSLWVVLESLGCEWTPQVLDWRLNERHYGALTGRSKDEAQTLFGAEAIRRWRRSFEAEPPPVDDAAAAFIPIDRRYAGLTDEQIPGGESLQQAARRVDAAWHEALVPQLREGRRVLVVGHGNALRALVKRLDSVPDADIARLEIGNGVPLVYELDGALQPVRKTVVPVPPWHRPAIL